MKPVSIALLFLLPALLGGTACSPSSQPPAPQPESQGQNSPEPESFAALAARALADADVCYDDLAEALVAEAASERTGISEALTQIDMNIVSEAELDLWFAALDAWRGAVEAGRGEEAGSVSGKVAAVRADCARILGRSWDDTGSGEPTFRACACVSLVRQRLRAWDPAAARADVWARLRNARLKLDGAEIVLDDGLSPVFSVPDDLIAGNTVQRRVGTCPDWCVRDASGADWMVCESDLADGEDLSGDWERLWAIRFEDGVPGEPRRIAEDVCVFYHEAMLELDPDGVPVFVFRDGRLRVDGSDAAP